MKRIRTTTAALAAGLAVLCMAGNGARADRAPTAQEREAIENVLRGAGFTSWEKIEFDDDPDDRVWEVDDAVGSDGQEYDLKLSESFEIIKRERD